MPVTVSRELDSKPAAWVTVFWEFTDDPSVETLESLTMHFEIYY